jgi:hypothetical protein
MTSRKYDLRMPGFFPALFFLTIVVVQNVPLSMTYMATGCDVTESDLTGSMFCACPEVGVSRPFFGCFRIFSRFFAMLCSTPRVLFITSAFSLWENDTWKTSNVAFQTLYFKRCGLKKYGNMIRGKQVTLQTILKEHKEF